ncbi:MAG: hypothetical protein J6D26_03895 [Clostridia bacterium]|nr:hypothetical protein [Clostridia bacterium]
MNKQHLCNTCQTGKESYLLDSRSPFCPYLEFYQDNKCPMYKAVSKKQKDKQALPTV